MCRFPGLFFLHSKHHRRCSDGVFLSLCFTPCFLSYSSILSQSYFFLPFDPNRTFYGVYPLCPSKQTNTTTCTGWNTYHIMGNTRHYIIRKTSLVATLVWLILHWLSSTLLVACEVTTSICWYSIHQLVSTILHMHVDKQQHFISNQIKHVLE